MILRTKLKLGLCLCLLLPYFAWADCFLVVENKTKLVQQGDCQTRHSPASTFKIPLSVMGYDAGILEDLSHPVWPYARKYRKWAVRPECRTAINPQSWMKNSCVWYSQQLTQRLGEKKFKQYVSAFEYGNQDVSGDRNKHNGLTQAWLSSSLQISPQEQLHFLQKLVKNQLPVSATAQTQTRALLLDSPFADGWTLYGKTGTTNWVDEKGIVHADRQSGWFVGWLQNEDNSRQLFFVQYIELPTTDPTQYAGPQARSHAIEQLRRAVGGAG